jgi:hypothetical protein
MAMVDGNKHSVVITCRLVSQKYGKTIWLWLNWSRRKSWAGKTAGSSVYLTGETMGTSARLWSQLTCCENNCSIRGARFWLHRRKAMGTSARLSPHWSQWKAMGTSARLSLHRYWRKAMETSARLSLHWSQRKSMGTSAWLWSQWYYKLVMWKRSWVFTTCPWGQWWGQYSVVVTLVPEDKYVLSYDYSGFRE